MYPRGRRLKVNKVKFLEEGVNSFFWGGGRLPQV